MTAIKHQGQRVGVFIDAQNLYHSARNLYGKRVNFGHILEVAVGDRTLIRALAYVITTESGEESEFFEALGKLGIETKAKDLQIFFGGAKKADWDVGLAIDAVKAAPKLDTVILVSGDGDFIPLVEYLQHNEGCQVEVISFKKSSSSRLIEACDDFTDMGEDPDSYLLYGRKHQAKNKNRDQQVKKDEPKNEKMSDKPREDVQNQKGNNKPGMSTQKNKTSPAKKENTPEQKQAVAKKQPKRQTGPRKKTTPKKNNGRTK